MPLSNIPDSTAKEQKMDGKKMKKKLEGKKYEKKYLKLCTITVSEPLKH